MTAYEALTAEYDYLAIKEKQLNKHGGYIRTSVFGLKRANLKKERPACWQRKSATTSALLGTFWIKQNHKSKARIQSPCVGFQ